MASSETTVLVPIDNVDDVGLRRAISDTEVNKLFLKIGDGKIDSHQNWKGRFKDNSDKMRTGSIRDVIDVLKSLNFLSKSKNLSFREKRMLDRAKFLVVSEITEVTEDVSETVEDKVAKALDRCLSNRTKVLARAKTARASKAAKASQVAKASKAAKASQVAKASKVAKVSQVAKASKVAKVRKAPARSTTRRAARAS